jgi:hypothetical protein
VAKSAGDGVPMATAAGLCALTLALSMVGRGYGIPGRR